MIHFLSKQYLRTDTNESTIALNVGLDNTNNAGKTRPVVLYKCFTSSVKVVTSQLIEFAKFGKAMFTFSFGESKRSACCRSM